jgi:hypothetical protein
MHLHPRPSCPWHPLTAVFCVVSRRAFLHCVCCAVAARCASRQYPFTADRKMMSTLVALEPGNPNGPLRLYVTGASEIVLSR